MARAAPTPPLLSPSLPPRALVGLANDPESHPWRQALGPQRFHPTQCSPLRGFHTVHNYRATCVRSVPSCTCAVMETAILPCPGVGWARVPSVSSHSSPALPLELSRANPHTVARRPSHSSSKSPQTRHPTRGQRPPGLRRQTFPSKFQLKKQVAQQTPHWVCRELGGGGGGAQVGNKRSWKGCAPSEGRLTASPRVLLRAGGDSVLTASRLLCRCWKGVWWVCAVISDHGIEAADVHVCCTGQPAEASSLAVPRAAGLPPGGLAPPAGRALLVSTHYFPALELSTGETSVRETGRAVSSLPGFAATRGH